MEEIKNKVAKSGLITLDLADFKANPKLIKSIDIKDYLWNEMVLKEKDFRADMKALDWSIFQNHYVYIHCSADAIIPTWAFMLVASNLQGICKNYIVGDQNALEKLIIEENIKALDLTLPEFASKRYIIKGCSDITDPAFAMTSLMKKIQEDALSIMYGEPCSTVPIYKKTKK